MQVILASNSPRRKKLLKQIYKDFLVCPSNVDETYEDNLPVEKIPMVLAQKKAQFIAKNYPNDLIIAADTIVVIHKEILGKPKNIKEAREMLNKLSNQQHEVITGVCLCLQGKEECFNEITKVYFKKLTELEIAEYIATSEPYDKAGGYAIQGKAGDFISKIEGDYDNVVGFPLQKIKDKLVGFLPK